MVRMAETRREEKKRKKGGRRGVMEGRARKKMKE